MKRSALAVGLGPPWSGAHVADTQPGEERGQAGRVCIRPGVVGHHPLDPDALVREECDRLEHEADGARGLLVGPDGDIGDPGRVVDRDMQVVVSAAPVVPDRRAEHPVPAAGRDPTQALHVHVDELARVLADVTDGRAREAVGMGEPAVPVSAEDAVHRRAWVAEERPQAVRADAQSPSSQQDPADLAFRQ